MMKQLSVFLPGDPPTATAQEKSVRVSGGRPQFYLKKRAREARAWLAGRLAGQAPAEPINAPIWMISTWYFYTPDPRRDGQPRATRPDTDNLSKALKDAMTDAGYWTDDGRVYRETIAKEWTNDVSKAGVHIVLQYDDKASTSTSTQAHKKEKAS